MASAPLTLTVAAAVLVGGPPLGLPAGVAVLVAAAAAATLHAAWLLRLAAGAGRRHPDGPGAEGAGAVTPKPLPRGTVFSLAALAAGVFGAGVSAVATPLAGYLAPVAGAALVAGLLKLPGVTVDTPGAIRRALDGVCVALWKFLTLLVLVLEQQGEPGPTVFTTCLLAVVGITVAVVSGVRAPLPRWAAVTAAGGVALLVLGLAVLRLRPAGNGTWLLVAGGLLVLGSVLVWAGACRSVYVDRQPGRPATDGILIGDPLLVAPVLAGAAAVLYALVSRGQIGTPAMAVGTLAVLAVAVRELLEAVALRRYSGRLDAQEATFRTLVAGSSDVIVVLDRDLSVRWQSAAAARQFGLSDQDVVGRPLRQLLHPGDAAAVVLDRTSPQPVRARLQDGFGAWRPVEVSVTDERGNPEVDGVVVHLRDVTAQQDLEHSLQRTQRTDPLTGLANRGTLLAHLEGRTGHLVMIGLDGFAGVNDLHGADVGDAMLVEAAARIRGAIGTGDVAARLNGDEFAVYTEVDKVHAFTLATRLLGDLGEPYRLPGADLQLSAGIGLAPAGGGAEESLRRAGLALRRAKRGGRGKVEWHDAAVEDAYVRRATLEQHLPQAAERGELDLAYHPVYDLVEGHPVGVEALLRWRHPTLGTVPPKETLEVARELGITGEIHDWVLNRACRQLSSWQHEGYRLWMSVNVEIDDLVAEGFAGRLSLTLDSHQIDPPDLVVELSEREIGADLDRAVEPLATVRAVGVRTALDGFGTGATSLAHLRRLPTDVLKVDGALFVSQPAAGGGAAPIMDVVVKLAQRLNVTVVAHGLEVERHLEVVRTAGCRYGQGHYYGTPAPAERIEAALVRQRTW
ncbi:putative bifunctional diguanylate cyclase/phosphodiesterase [Dactylosporangium sp. NPDC000521]|uniref:putative bifunctional diguanylate cyclase/phosphodiesterase n=1 Tax=Dactylosporangium sp. NPDC000521 TaxID=3363975 RepID=UPI0036B177AC